MTALARDDRTAPTAATPTRRWRRDHARRATAYVGVVLLGTALLVLLALSAQRPTAPLDPEGPGPEGAMALDLGCPSAGPSRQRQCDLNVYHLSEMSREEAEVFLGEREGRVCVRL